MSAERRTHIRRVLDEITLPNYLAGAFRIDTLGDSEWIQLRFYAQDTTQPTGLHTLQSGRKWLISRHATDSEIVQTAFLAVLTAAEHEVRETFRYRGQAIYGPHFSANCLALFAYDESNHDVRAPQTKEVAGG